METLINVIHPFFTATKWHCVKKENTVRYMHTDRIYDEFIISLLPRTAEIEVSVPIADALYKKKFNTKHNVVEYVKMHLDYYDKVQ